MMTTLANHTLLDEPKSDDRISGRALGYVSQSTRDALFDLITRAYIESGISKATLAKRMNKDPAQITRLLNASGNWTIDTCAELLFAINGAFLKIDSYWWPQRLATTNQNWSPLNLIKSTGEITALSTKMVISHIQFDDQRMPVTTSLRAGKWA